VTFRQARENIELLLKDPREFMRGVKLGIPKTSEEELKKATEYYKKNPEAYGMGVPALVPWLLHKKPKLKEKLESATVPLLGVNVPAGKVLSTFLTDPPEWWAAREKVKKKEPLSKEDRRALSQMGLSFIADVGEPVRAIGKVAKATSALHIPSKNVYAEITPKQLDILRDEVKYIPFTKYDRPHLTPITSLAREKVKKISLEDMRKLSPNIDTAVSKIAKLGVPAAKLAKAGVKPPTVESQIDDLIDIARKRMGAADQAIVGLRPAEVDWLTVKERTKLEKLKAALPRRKSPMEAAEAIRLKKEKLLGVGAKIPKALEPLAEEARKFKSAEEFVGDLFGRGMEGKPSANKLIATFQKSDFPGASAAPTRGLGTALRNFYTQAVSTPKAKVPTAKLAKAGLELPKAPKEVIPDDVQALFSAIEKEAKQEATEGRWGSSYPDIKKFVNFLKFAGEKTSKETGLLFREHIPRSVFGVGTDEVAAKFSMSENDLMADLVDMAGITGGDIGRVRSIIGRKSPLGTAMKRAVEKTPKFRKALEKLPDFQPKTGVYLAEAGERAQKIRAKQAAAMEKRIYGEWAREARKGGPTPTRLAKQVRRATDAALKAKTRAKAGDVHLADYAGTPEYVFERLGIHETVYRPIKDGLRQYRMEVNTGYKQLNQWWKEVGKAPEASKRIFRYLDGQAQDLTPPELKVAGEMQDWLAKWADRLDLPQEKRITNYITHIFDQEITGKKALPDEIYQILDYVTPSGVFHPFLQKRTGALGYKESAFEALDAYLRRSARKVSLDKPMEHAAAVAKNLPQSSFDYTNKILKKVARRPDWLDTQIDRQMNALTTHLPEPIRNEISKSGAIRNFTGTVRQAVFRGTLGFNAKSAVRNLTQGVNTFAELGGKYTTHGYLKLLSPKAGVELKEANLVKEAVQYAYRRPTWRGTADKFDRILFAFFDFTEQINRGAAYYGAKRQALDAGLKEADAVKKALDVVRKTQFDYSPVDMPYLFQTTLGKVGLQLGTYPVKQGEFLLRMIKDKEGAKLLRYALASATMIGVAGELLGIDYKDFFTAFLPTPGPIPRMIWPGYKRKRDITPLIPGGVAIRRILKAGKSKKKKSTGGVKVQTGGATKIRTR